MPCNPNNRRAGGGFTLIELMMVIIIVSIMSVAIVAEMHGTFQEALLRSTSRELATAFSAASSRAISVNRPYRIDIDTFEHRYLVESARRSSADFYPVRDVPGGSGALDSRIAIQILQRDVNAPDDSGQEPSENENGPPARLAEGDVTFYPDGTADARQVELTDRDGYKLALRINPITSRVQITAVRHP